MLSSAAFGWGSAGGRPGPVLPPTMSGSAGLHVAIDVLAQASANWSHQPGSIVDDSRDWRNRIWRWFAVVNTNAQVLFPWDRSNALPPRVIAATGTTLQGGGMAFGFGQSFVADSLGVIKFPVQTLAMPMVAQLSVQNANLPQGTNVVLYVDMTSGALCIAITGTPSIRAFFWLEASGQFPNA